MAKSKISYAEIISRAQVMTTALNANAEKVAKRGLDEAFIAAMEDDRQTAKTLNDEQEKLKADLKTKTSALNDKMDALAKKYSEAKKMVKLDFPQSQWKEFGIEDKR